MTRSSHGISTLLVWFGCFLWIATAGCSAAPEHKAPKTGGIVTMAPHLTEVVFALGEGHRITGVSEYCDYPPEVKELPAMGGYLDPDFETIALRKPDLLIVAGKHPELSEFAQLKRLDLLNVHMDSFETIDAGIQTIGEALGVEKAADELRAKIDADLDAVRDAVANRPRPSVLIINTRLTHDLNSLFTVGGNSFVSEVVRVAGGDNIFADETQPYLEASKETVVVREPEVILEFHSYKDVSAEELEQFRRDWRQLPMLPAVKNDRVYLLTETHVLRPGPRIGLTARMIARLLHPDAELPE